MPRRVFDRIRTAIRTSSYDMTEHAAEEMVEDELDIVDVETAILNGTLVKTKRGDPRGTRYTVRGTAADGRTPVGIVGRFSGSGCYLIFTVYEVKER